MNAMAAATPTTPGVAVPFGTAARLPVAVLGSSPALLPVEPPRLEVAVVTTAVVALAETATLLAAMSGFVLEFAASMYAAVVVVTCAMATPAPAVAADASPVVVTVEEFFATRARSPLALMLEVPETWVVAALVVFAVAMAASAFGVAAAAVGVEVVVALTAEELVSVTSPLAMIALAPFTTTAAEDVAVTFAMPTVAVLAVVDEAVAAISIVPAWIVVLVIVTSDDAVSLALTSVACRVTVPL